MGPDVWVLGDHVDAQESRFLDCPDELLAEVEEVERVGAFPHEPYLPWRRSISQVTMTHLETDVDTSWFDRRRAWLDAIARTHEDGQCVLGCSPCGREAAAYLAGIPPELRALGSDAWTKSDAMSVLADRLLETGFVTIGDDERSFTPDDERFLIEGRTREWILTLLRPDRLELHPRGRYPDVEFEVYRNYAPRCQGALATVCDRVEVFGTKRQPRLLRSP